MLYYSNPLLHPLRAVLGDILLERDMDFSPGRITTEEQDGGICSLTWIPVKTKKKHKVCLGFWMQHIFHIMQHIFFLADIIVVCVALYFDSQRTNLIRANFCVGVGYV